MLTENDVILHVCTYLERNGYVVTQRLSTRETGVDITAKSASGVCCFVEAKGATSSKPSTSKYGKEFNKSQVKTHVGVALVAAYKALNTMTEAESLIALPDNENHRMLISEMREPISRSGIGVLLVTDQGDVQRYI